MLQSHSALWAKAKQTNEIRNENEKQLFQKCVSGGYTFLVCWPEVNHMDIV